MEQMVPEDHFLRKVDRAVDFSFIYDLCAPLYCAENGRPAIDPEILFRMLFVGYLYGIKSEARLEEEVNYNIAYKWFCGLDLTQKAPDATTISQNRRRRFRDNNIAEQIFNEILRQCVEKGLVGGGILYTDSTHIKAKANKHKKKQVEVAVTPKAYLAELDAQVDQEREELGKKPFEREDGEHRGGGSAKRMQSTTDPESGQQSREGKPNGFYYSEHRTVDSKRNVIVNVHVEPANINDVTALPEILDEIETRLGTLPRYMGLDAGYHNAGIAHLLERKGIQGVIGYRRHTHKGAHYGKYRFGYDAERDEYICPEKQRLTWKNTTREGYRQYCCESKICKGCARRRECFGASMSRKVVERHVWQGALDRVIAFTKTHRGKKIYGWRKETIERSFAEAKENHGLRYARMLGIANMREQCFLTAAVQNIKRLVASLRRVYLYIIPCIFTQMQGFVNALRRGAARPRAFLLSFLIPLPFQQPAGMSVQFEFVFLPVQPGVALVNEHAVVVVQIHAVQLRARAQDVQNLVGSGESQLTVCQKLAEGQLPGSELSCGDKLRPSRGGGGHKVQPRRVFALLRTQDQRRRVEAQERRFRFGAGLQTSDRFPFAAQGTGIARPVQGQRPERSVHLICQASICRIQISRIRRQPGLGRLGQGFSARCKGDERNQKAQRQRKNFSHVVLLSRGRRASTFAFFELF